MKSLLLKLLLFCLLSVNTFQSFASHLVGSEISYSCTTTPGIWHIKIAFYRDCSGTPMGNCTGVCGSTCSYTINWAVTDPGYNYSGNFNVNLTSVSNLNAYPTCATAKSNCTNMGCETAGNFTPGIEKYLFEGDVDLGTSVIPANCCNVRIYYSECCRNAGITTGAAGQNFYIEALINRCATPCNNSPEFSNDPFAILCGGQAFTFNNGAIDPDHDSLTFAFAPALKDSGTSVTYNPPYSYDAPMPYGTPKNGPFPLGIRCDAHSGDIMFTPSYGSSSNFIGVMAIEVKQWRTINGVPTNIGTTRRDIQMWLISCPPNHPPTIMTSPSSGIQPILSWQVCAGQQICFNVIGKDTDFLPYNSPSISDTTYVTWNGALASKGATFLPTYNLANRTTNGPREDNYQFCWTPSDSDASPIPYYFTATSKDSRCPYPGKATRSFVIQVLAKAGVSIVKNNLGCGKWSLSYIKNIPSQTFTSTVWYISKVPNDYSGMNFRSYANTVTPPNQNFTIGGKYLIELDINTAGSTGGLACQAKFFDTLFVDSASINKSLNISVNDTFSCSANPINIHSTITHTNTSPPYHYKWYDANLNTTILSLTDSLIIVPSSTKIFTVEVTDSFNCFATKNFKVSGKPTTSAITGCTTCNKNTNQSYYVNYTSGSTYQWLITNGTEFSGGNTYWISVKWGNQNTGKVAVQESNSYCVGDTVSLNVNLTNTGIDEENVFNNFSVFPNPTTGLLNIELETSEKNIDLEVFDIIGKSLLKTTAKHNGGLLQKTIDISHLHEGIYFVKISAGEKNTTVKVSLK